MEILLYCLKQYRFFSSVMYFVKLWVHDFFVLETVCLNRYFNDNVYLTKAFS